jgi:hypothetical protein
MQSTDVTISSPVTKGAVRLLKSYDPSDRIGRCRSKLDFDVSRTCGPEMEDDRAIRRCRVWSARPDSASNCTVVKATIGVMHPRRGKWEHDYTLALCRNAMRVLDIGADTGAFLRMARSGGSPADLSHPIGWWGRASLESFEQFSPMNGRESAPSLCYKEQAHNHSRSHDFSR